MTFDHIFNALTGVCEIAIWWMIWQDYRKARGKPDFKMPARKWVLMVVLSLIPVGTLIYHRQNVNPPAPNMDTQKIPEFDEPDTSVTGQYGMDTPDSCYMTANGTSLLSRQSGYKLAIACLSYDGKEDILDAPYLQISNLYDIRQGQIRMRVEFQEYLKKYRTEMNAIGIDIALLNVPNGVQPSQFSTLRQARALGVSEEPVHAAVDSAASASAQMRITVLRSRVAFE